MNGKAQEATYLWDPDSKEAAAQNEVPVKELIDQVVMFFFKKNCLMSVFDSPS